jgi:hypothetical protein
MLGVSRGMLWGAEAGAVLRRIYQGLGGKRGKAVPLLSPNGGALDPGAKGYARPHEMWGGAWEWLARDGAGGILSRRW